MRYWFGDAPADFVVAPGQQEQLTEELIGYTAVLVPGAVLWVWDYTTGDRLTDLLDDSGQPVEEITAESYGRIPRFRGPDEVRRLLIGQPSENGEGDGGGESPHRWVLTSTDWPTIVDGLDTRIADLEEGDGEIIASAHPIMWTMAGQAESRRSAHPYVNIEGKTQTITAVRAQATVTSGAVTAQVLTMDMDTGSTTVVAALILDTTGESRTVIPEAAVSDGTGVTVEVQLDDEESDEVEDITVQVMIR